MPIVKYTDEEGRAWMVAVPDNTRPEQYPFGARLGPPDLSELGLDAAILKKLYSGLVERGIFDGQTIMNRRRDVREILTGLGLSIDLERWITSIFGREYF